jgi:hypothetical protein
MNTTKNLSGFKVIEVAILEMPLQTEAHFPLTDKLQVALAVDM